jgi:hypothetical protein
LWAAARSHGISSEEFWGMTLCEFTAIMDRCRDREELAFLRAGIVSSTIANCNRDSKQEAFTPQDFMPSSMVHQELSKETSAEEWNANMRLMNAAFGGKDLTLGSR